MNARKKRLIDASAIKYHTHRECGGHGIFYDVTTALKEDIDALPTVDAVEVVRCKDCKWWIDQKCTNINGTNCLVLNGDWFCCAGERKMDKKKYLIDPREKLALLIVSDLPKKDQKANATAAKELADHLFANDVVPVVRCKDCKHRKEEFCFHENWWKDDGFTAVCENDFCSYGERKE